MTNRAMKTQSSEELKRLSRIQVESNTQSQLQQDSQARDRMAGESPATFTRANEQQSQQTLSVSRIRNDPAISANFINQGGSHKISEEAGYERHRIALLAIGLPIMAMSLAAYFAWKEKACSRKIC